MHGSKMTDVQALDTAKAIEGNLAIMSERLGLPKNDEFYLTLRKQVRRNCEWVESVVEIEPEQEGGADGKKD